VVARGNSHKGYLVLIGFSQQLPVRGCGHKYGLAVLSSGSPDCVMQDRAAAIREGIDFIQDDKVESPEESERLVGGGYDDIRVPIT
jgi:hypothetical protein